MELAIYILRCKMDGEVPEGNLMKKALSGCFTEKGYELTCKAEYIENIAQYGDGAYIPKKETLWNKER